MFEGIGKIGGNENPGVETGKAVSESMIPEMIDDPRRYIKAGVEEETAPEMDEAFGSEDDLEKEAKRLRSNVLDFFSQTDLTSLVRNKMDDDELRSQLDARLDQFIGRQQGTITEKRAEAMKDLVEMNLRDSRRLDRIKNFILANRGDAEKIKAFWSDFDSVFRQERGARKWRCEYQTPTRIKWGVLGELAAAELLNNMEAYFHDPRYASDDRLRFRGIDFSKIRIRVENATPEEDVLQQTDLKLHISYEGKEFTLPVQVKCKYLESMDSEMGDFINENACILSRHGISREAPYGEDINRFFRKYPKGVFMVIPRGCESYEIDENGFPSDKLCLLICEQMKIETYDLLRDNLSQDE